MVAAFPNFKAAIQSTYKGGFKCVSTQVCTDMSQSEQSGCSNRISNNDICVIRNTNQTVAKKIRLTEVSLR